MTDSKTATERLTHVLDTIEPGETVDMVIDMSDGKTATERLREMLDARGVDYRIDFDGSTEWDALTGDYSSAVDVGGGKLVFTGCITPEQAVAATLGDETPKKCSTCQYRYCVGQRPYPSFGYRCGFGDGKKLCGGNTSVLDHMCCEYWEKELR